MFTNHFYSSKQTNKMNGHFMGFGQLIQKLEQITLWSLLIFETNKMNGYRMGFQ